MNKLKVDITTLRATDGSHCPFFKHMSTVKSFDPLCVWDNCAKSHYHQKFGVKPLWDLILSCDLQIFRCECGLRCQRGNRGTLRVQIAFFRRLWPGWLTTYRHMSMLFLFLWVFYQSVWLHHETVHIFGKLQYHTCTQRRWDSRRWKRQKSEA